MAVPFTHPAIPFSYRLCSPPPHAQASPSSELVVALTEASRWSDFASKLSGLSAAAEWKRAEADGVVRPSRKGVEAAYDEAQAAVEAAEQELQVRKYLDFQGVVAKLGQRLNW